MIMIMALCAFALGATAGIFLALRHFTRKRLPAWLALVHGVGGATGFTLVLLIVVREPAFQLARQALYLFIAAIGFGCVNLLFHLRKVRHRTSLILVHALCAVSGVGTLIYAIFTHDSTALAATPAKGQASPVALPTTIASESHPSLEAPEPAASVAARAAPLPVEPVRPNGEHGLGLDGATRAALAQSINFQTGSSELRSDSLPAIARLGKLLSVHPELALIEVQGHADERGEDSANIELTRARAEAVVAALVSRGISAERLRAAGYGARCPVDPQCARQDAPASCHDAARWASDRRVLLLPLRVGDASFHGAVACERAVSLIPAEDRPFQSLTR